MNAPSSWSAAFLCRFRARDNVPKAAEECRTPRPVGAWLATFALSLISVSEAHAHDPYEITSTTYLRSNRLDLEIEMEFRTALSLTGVENPWSLKDAPEELFQSKLPQLREAAGRFFRVTAAGNPLAARATNVSLGVENHVRFALEFPADDRRPLRFAADGLKPFEGQGLYGTSLTVLDMVNKKVLSQSVLFPSTSVAEVLEVPSHPSHAPAEPIHVVREQIAPQTGAATTPVASPTARKTFWSSEAFLLLAGLLLLVGIAWWLNRRRTN